MLADWARAQSNLHQRRWQPNTRNNSVSNFVPNVRHLNSLQRGHYVIAVFWAQLIIALKSDLGGWAADKQSGNLNQLSLPGKVGLLNVRGVHNRHVFPLKCFANVCWERGKKMHGNGWRLWSRLGMSVCQPCGIINPVNKLLGYPCHASPRSNPSTSGWLASAEFMSVVIS